MASSLHVAGRALQDIKGKIVLYCAKGDITLSHVLKHRCSTLNLPVNQNSGESEQNIFCTKNVWKDIVLPASDTKSAETVTIDVSANTTSGSLIRAEGPSLQVEEETPASNENCVKCIVIQNDGKTNQIPGANTTLVITAGEVLIFDVDLVAQPIGIESVLFCAPKFKLQNINRIFDDEEQHDFYQPQATYGKSGGNIFMYTNRIDAINQTIIFKSVGSNGRNGANGKNGKDGSHDSIITNLFQTKLQSYNKQFDVLYALLGENTDSESPEEALLDESKNDFLCRLYLFEQTLCPDAPENNEGFLDSKANFQKILTQFVAKSFNKIQQKSNTNSQSGSEQLNQENVLELFSVLSKHEAPSEHFLAASEWTILLLDHWVGQQPQNRDKKEEDSSVEIKTEVMQTLLVQFDTYLKILCKSANSKCLTKWKDSSCGGNKTDKMLGNADIRLQIFKRLLFLMNSRLSIDISSENSDVFAASSNSTKKSLPKSIPFCLDKHDGEQCPAITYFDNLKQKASSVFEEVIENEMRVVHTSLQSNKMFCYLRKCQIVVHFLEALLEQVIPGFHLTTLNFLDVDQSIKPNSDYVKPQQGMSGEDGDEGGLAGCRGETFLSTHECRVKAAVVEQGKPGEKGAKGKNGKCGASYVDRANFLKAKPPHLPETQNSVGGTSAENFNVPQRSDERQRNASSCGQTERKIEFDCVQDCQIPRNNWGIEILQNMFDSRHVSAKTKHMIITNLSKIDTLWEPLCTSSFTATAYLNLFTLGRTYFSSEEHATSESEFLKILTTIYDKASNSSDKHCTSIHLILDCCTRKLAEIQLCLKNEIGPLSDMYKNLQGGLRILEKLQERKCRLDQLTNCQKLLTNIDAKILSKSQQFGSHVRSNKLADSIRDMFVVQKQDCYLELNAYLALLEKDGRFYNGKKREERTKGVGGVVGAVLGGLLSGGALISMGYQVGSTLGGLVGAGVDKINQLPVGDFNVPECLLPNLALTPQRHETEIRNTFEEQIHIFDGYLKQELSCEQVRNLSNEMQLIVNGPVKPKINKILAAQQTLYQTLLQAKRKYQQVNTVWVPLAFMYCNLVVCEKGDVPPIFKKNGRARKTSVIEVAKQRIESFPLLYESVLNCLVDLLTHEIGKGHRMIQPSDLRDTVFKVKAHLETYTNGLPTQPTFELCFSKVNNLVDLYEKHWLEIETLEKEKSTQVTIADYSPLNLKLAQVEYFTDTEILLLMYKHIKKSIIHWTFPFVEHHIRAVDIQIKYMEKVFVQQTAKSDEFVVTAVENCSKMVNILLRILDNKVDDSNELWIVDDLSFNLPKGYFYKWPGSAEADKSVDEAGIKQLLQGGTVEFCALVDYSPVGCDAIKFDKTINIQFTCEGFKKLGSNNTSSDESNMQLQRILENFVLEMTQFGESWYRVSNGKYVVKHRPIKLTKIASNNCGGFQNETRRQLTNFEASPYTIWTLQLKPLPAGLQVNVKDTETGHKLEDVISTPKSKNKREQGQDVKDGTASILTKNTGSENNTKEVFKELMEFEEENCIALYLVGNAKFCRSEDILNLNDRLDYFGIDKIE